MVKAFAFVSLAAAAALAQTAQVPAARAHVKMVNNQAIKYTSKLTTIVELNFTFGNTHQAGKIIIRDALDRIAKNYGAAGSNAFTVKHIASSVDGSKAGELPNFSLDDLLSGEVIVANNISAFGDATLGATRQKAIQQAIETDGRGYIGFHGSGDNQKADWPWYTSTLHPMNYGGHGSRTVGPVYRHLDEASHVVLENILTTKTTIAANVPNELDAAGNEKLAPNVPVRGMKNEWYRFGRDISRDAAFKDKVTTLLKYDARTLGSDALPDANKRKGGNLYTYILQVGKGNTMYIPAGHENDELLDAGTGFDGGSGDFDRYLAQSMFFLAGYKTGLCDASCNGLPVVDSKNRLTGEKYQSTGTRSYVARFEDGVWFDPNKVAFSSKAKGPWEAVVSDMAGRILETKRGNGLIYHAFDKARFGTGVYFLTVKQGRKAPRVKRYAFLP